MSLAVQDFGGAFGLARSQKLVVGSPAVITAGDVTKMTSVTLAVTPFPFVFNEIRSVTAFTPFFVGVVITINGFNQHPCVPLRS